MTTSKEQVLLAVEIVREYRTPYIGVEPNAAFHQAAGCIEDAFIQFFTQQDIGFNRHAFSKACKRKIIVKADGTFNKVKRITI